MNYSEEYTQLIHYYTFDRDLSNYTETMEKCIAELIEYRKFNDGLVKSLQNSIGKKSEKVGQHSIDYGDYGDAQIDAMLTRRHKREYEIIKKYFGVTGLMYRGGGMYDY